MSFDFEDRQKLDKILKKISNYTFQPPTPDFKHLDQLAEKVRYDIANHERWAESAKTDCSGTYSLEMVHKQQIGRFEDVLRYIDEIKAGEK